MVVVGLSKESANLELWDALQVMETDSFLLSVWLTHIVLQIVLNMLLNTENSTHFINLFLFTCYLWIMCLFFICFLSVELC